MRTAIVFTTGLFVGYTLRSRRNQALHNVAGRIVDALFAPATY